MKTVLGLIFAAFAVTVCAGQNDAAIREAYQALPDSTDELGLERLVGKLSPEEVAQIAQLIEAANVLIEDQVQEKEKTDSGRKLLHGRIVGQKVDFARSMNVLTYEDGWTYEEPLRKSKPMTLAERNAATLRQRAKTLPPGLVLTIERRNAAAVTTNTVNAVITPWSANDH